jgi:hypothetical protein
MTMSPVQRGIEAETEVLRAFVRAGVQVWLPWGEGSAADLLAEIDGRVMRVQVKAGRLREDVIMFKTCSTDHGRGAQPYAGRADVIAVHCRDLDTVHVVPVEELGARGAHLRVRPARNNQQRRVRLASDHTLERWLADVRGGAKVVADG